MGIVDTTTGVVNLSIILWERCSHGSVPVRILTPFLSALHVNIWTFVAVYPEYNWQRSYPSDRGGFLFTMFHTVPYLYYSVMIMCATMATTNTSASLYHWWHCFSMLFLLGTQPVGPSDGPPNVSQALADQVSKLVINKFSSLTNGFTSPYARRKVLAGIVQTCDDDIENAQVLCVTTGTKCINGEYMSDKGFALNDCHAEVIARRCLRLYFFNQLELHTSTDTAPGSVFERLEPGGFKLKEGIKYHLYISTSPCGDARIFSPHESAIEGGENGADRHPNRKARGQLRTKIESGEGTIPVRSSTGIQTWDGVLQGERLLTMSCSDKIARWNVIGIQGSIPMLLVS